MMPFYAVCLVVVFLITSVMIYCKHYNDGVVKKFGLGVLWLICLGVLSDFAQGWEYDPSPITMAIVFGFTWFLCSHFYCWLRYVTGGDFSWHQIKKVAQIG